MAETTPLILALAKLAEAAFALSAAQQHYNELNAAAQAEAAAAGVKLGTGQAFAEEKPTE